MPHLPAATTRNMPIQPALDTIALVHMSVSLDNRMNQSSQNRLHSLIYFMCTPHIQPCCKFDNTRSYHTSVPSSVSGVVVSRALRSSQPSHSRDRSIVGDAFRGRHSRLRIVGFSTPLSADDAFADILYLCIRSSHIQKDLLRYKWHSC